MNETERAEEALREAVVMAAGAGEPLRIIGGGSKSFYGREIGGRALSVSSLRGVVAHEPSELVFTALAGTPLREVEDVLAAANQGLAFEPPHFGEAATLGGTIACGLSGPRRPYAGAVRDFVLGVRCMNGKGEILRFGGRVMKNVAGYDVSRLMAGSLGTLGIILEVSLKVLPQPESERTLCYDMPVVDAIERMNRWAGKPLPLSAAIYYADALWVRFSGAPGAVDSAHKSLGGAVVADSARLWRDLREHNLEFFRDRQPLWRLSVPPACPHLPMAGEWLIDWGGAQRWLKTNLDPQAVRAPISAAGGHATLFRGGDRHGQVFTPLDPVALRIHCELKRRFDPRGIFNIGRMYAEF
ncbi:MAG: glycolate oxidase subunit GlcE [Chromatiales bacterium]